MSAGVENLEKLWWNAGPNGMVGKHGRVYRRQTMWNAEGAETDFPTAVINDKQVQAGQVGVAVGVGGGRGFSISQLSC